ncbi:uncharacterized protein LOC111680132 [Lucilia cuprina]|uniref:uncharacterized protein LOC111680132 n=1 Tax=Lucilia cuprina TaxID=7375 RepID=UPI001F056F88|nr:uncharacterized protein LOC111680132 [Lucilia cuprina]
MNSKIIILLFANILALSRGADDFGSQEIYTTNVLASTSTLGGVNCLIEAVFNVENLANDFSYNIQVCNVNASAVVSEILNLCNTITENTEAIINTDDNVCKNAAYEESDAGNLAPVACTQQINTLMVNLFTAVSNTYNYLALDESTIGDTCSAIAANTLKINLPILPESVNNCALLFKQ